MSATERYMLLGGSTSLESIGNVAYSTSAHHNQSFENNDYQNLINDNDVHFRMIESQFGTAQAYQYRQSTALRKKFNEQEDREKTARWAARRAKLNREPIKRAVVNICRALPKLSHHKSRPT